MTMEYSYFFKRFLKFSGIFNISAAFLFLVPQLYKRYLMFYNHINAMLGMGGASISMPTDSFHELMINTAGIDLVLIGTIVLLVSGDPQNPTNRKIIIANGTGRFMFFLLVGYYALFHGLIRIMIPFGIIDAIITITFFYLLHKTSHEARKREP